ncbi:MAG: HAD family hydrolase [Bacilli bacterium]|nr:HAD family hydrolase [Bacilli bacterium]
MKNMIIFDLDGTLWDPADETCRVVNDYLKENGYPFEVSRDVIVDNMGYEFDVCAERYFPQLEEKEAHQLLEKIYDREVELMKDGLVMGKVFDHVSETIEKLSKKYMLCIVSNCSNEYYIENFINAAKVSKYITDYVAANNFFISKAEAIRKVKSKYKADKIIYVGDTLKDQVSAVDAGGVFVYAKYGFGDDLYSRFSIHDIHELSSLASYIFEE